MVLEKAGASLVRDSADRRLIKGIRERTHHMINSPKDVGGWPKLKSLPAPPDKDRDGMADAWEKKQGLDPTNPSDRNKVRNGWTNLELYLNSLVFN